MLCAPISYHSQSISVVVIALLGLILIPLPPCRILCSNRDEFLARPALAAAFHSFGDANSDSPSNSNSQSSPPRAGDATVLSGRDTQAGGTWLGLTPGTGRVALLTNITEPYQSLPSSRGSLAPAFLLGKPRTPLETLYPQGSYAGFNLLVLEAEWEASSSSAPPQPTASASISVSPRLHFPHAFLVSNGGAGGQLLSRPLRAEERTSGGLSNGLHVTETGGEAWPKVAQGRTLFSDTVKAHDEALRRDDARDADAALAGRLFALLRTAAAEPVRAREELRRTICVRPLEISAKPRPDVNNAQTPDSSASAVPATINGTGTPIPSTPTIYGTRTASVLLVRRSGDALFVERDVWRLKPGGVELYEGGAIGGTGSGKLAGEEDGERVFRVRVGAQG
ncbi:hypothetical protein MVEN_00348500 [Mycena venus]|uniref:Uncharacterized protein n=1 Tax=Mycena venus TaxID=2733690 RepID=A0A8H6YPB5_9AGAR|nr:hypothetical protein MVEN_00348500 [Mycena venus]